MLYVSSSYKEKLFLSGINLISYIIIPFDETNIYIILVHKVNYLEGKIYSNSLDVDNYNNIILAYNHGCTLTEQQTKSFFYNQESLLLDIKKRFPKHFNNNGK